MQEREEFASGMYLRKPGGGSGEQIKRLASRSMDILFPGLGEKAGYMNTVAAKCVDVLRVCESFDSFCIFSDIGSDQ